MPIDLHVPTPFQLRRTHCGGKDATHAPTGRSTRHGGVKVYFRDENHENMEMFRDAWESVTSPRGVTAIQGMSKPLTPPRRPGRPRKENPLTDAERSKRYRDKLRARLAELRDLSQPVRSTVIDLSALPPWKRRA